MENISLACDCPKAVITLINLNQTEIRESRQRIQKLLKDVSPDVSDCGHQEKRVQSPVQSVDDYRQVVWSGSLTENRIYSCSKESPILPNESTPSTLKMIASLGLDDSRFSWTSSLATPPCQEDAGDVELFETEGDFTRPKMLARTLFSSNSASDADDSWHYLSTSLDEKTFVEKNHTLKADSQIHSDLLEVYEGCIIPLELINSPGIVPLESHENFEDDDIVNKEDNKYTGNSLSSISDDTPLRNLLPSHSLQSILSTSKKHGSLSKHVHFANVANNDDHQKTTETGLLCFEVERETEISDAVNVSIDENNEIVLPCSITNAEMHSDKVIVDSRSQVNTMVQQESATEECNKSGSTMANFESRSCAIDENPGTLQITTNIQNKSCENKVEEFSVQKNDLYCSEVLPDKISLHVFCNEEENKSCDLEVNPEQTVQEKVVWFPCKSLLEGPSNPLIPMDQLGEKAAETDLKCLVSSTIEDEASVSLEDRGVGNVQRNSPVLLSMADQSSECLEYPLYVKTSDVGNFQVREQGKIEEDGLKGKENEELTQFSQRTLQLLGTIIDENSGMPVSVGGTAAKSKHSSTAVLATGCGEFTQFSSSYEEKLVDEVEQFSDSILCRKKKHKQLQLVGNKGKEKRDSSTSESSDGNMNSSELCLRTKISSIAEKLKAKIKQFSYPTFSQIQHTSPKSVFSFKLILTNEESRPPMDNGAILDYSIQLLLKSCSGNQSSKMDHILKQRVVDDAPFGAVQRKSEYLSKDGNIDNHLIKSNLDGAEDTCSWDRPGRNYKVVAGNDRCNNLSKISTSLGEPLTTSVEMEAGTHLFVDAEPVKNHRVQSRKTRHSNSTLGPTSEKPKCRFGNVRGDCETEKIADGSCSWGAPFKHLPPYSNAYVSVELDGLQDQDGSSSLFKTGSDKLIHVNEKSFKKVKKYLSDENLGDFSFVQKENEVVSSQTFKVGCTDGARVKCMDPDINLLCNVPDKKVADVRSRSETSYNKEQRLNKDVVKRENISLSPLKENAERKKASLNLAEEIIEVKDVLNSTLKLENDGEANTTSFKGVDYVARENAFERNMGFHTAAGKVISVKEESMKRAEGVIAIDDCDLWSKITFEGTKFQSAVGEKMCNTDERFSLEGYNDTTADDIYFPNDRSIDNKKKKVCVESLIYEERYQQDNSQMFDKNVSTTNACSLNICSVMKPLQDLEKEFEMLLEHRKSGKDSKGFLPFKLSKRVIWNKSTDKPMNQKMCTGVLRQESAEEVGEVAGVCGQTSVDSAVVLNNSLIEHLSDVGLEQTRNMENVMMNNSAGCQYGGAKNKVGEVSQSCHDKIINDRKIFGSAEVAMLETELDSTNEYVSSRTVRGNSGFACDKDRVKNFAVADECYSSNKLVLGELEKTLLLDSSLNRILSKEVVNKSEFSTSQDKQTPFTSVSAENVVKEYCDLQNELHSSESKSVLDKGAPLDAPLFEAEMCNKDRKRKNKFVESQSNQFKVGNESNKESDTAFKGSVNEVKVNFSRNSRSLHKNEELDTVKGFRRMTVFSRNLSKEIMTDIESLKDRNSSSILLSEVDVNRQYSCMLSTQNPGRLLQTADESKQSLVKPIVDAMTWKNGKSGEDGGSLMALGLPEKNSEKLRGCSESLVSDVYEENMNTVEPDSEIMLDISPCDAKVTHKSDCEKEMQPNNDEAGFEMSFGEHNFKTQCDTTSKDLHKVEKKFNDELKSSKKKTRIFNPEKKIKSFTGFQTAGGRFACMSKDALHQAKKSYMDTEIEPAKRNFHETKCQPAELIGFRTASGKNVPVSDDALHKAKKRFRETECQPAELIGFQTAGGKNVPVSDDALHKAKKKFRETECQPAELVGFQTASGKNVPISDDALHKAKKKFRETECQPAELIGFQTASGKNVPVSDDALHKAKKKFCETECQPAELVGFQTASGKNVPVSDDALHKVKKRFHETECQPAELIGFQTAGGKNVLVSDDALHKAKKKFCETECQPAELVGFQTASGKNVPVSDDALHKVKKRFHETECQPAELIGFQTAGGKNVLVSDDALHKAKKKFCETECQPAELVGFQTASGKNVPVSDDALHKAKKKFRETECQPAELVGFQTASGKNVPISDDALHKAKKKFRETECQPAELIGFQNASGKNVPVSDDTLHKAKKKFCETECQPAELVGFQTASGKNVPVSDDALHKVKKRFHETECQPAELIGFQTASGKNVPVSDDALHKVKKRFHETECQPAELVGFQTASGKNVPISDDALHKAKKKFRETECQPAELIGFQNASGKNVPVSDDALHKAKKKFCETECQPAELVGFQTASGKNVPVSDDALHKVKKRFHETECQPAELIGFQTAGGKNVLVSDDALHKVKKRFHETECQPAELIGFQTAGGKNVPVSDDALHKAKKRFHETECQPAELIGFQTAGGKNVPVSDDALHKAKKRFHETECQPAELIGFQTASGKNVPVSDDALHKVKKRFHETECQPAELIGFQTASGKNVPVSDDALHKAKKRFHETECQPAELIGFQTAGGKNVPKSDDVLQQATQLFYENECKPERNAEVTGFLTAGRKAIQTSTNSLAQAKRRIYENEIIDSQPVKRNSKRELRNVETLGLQLGEANACTSEVTMCHVKKRIEASDQQNFLKYSNMWSTDVGLTGFQIAGGKHAAVLERSLLKAKVGFDSDMSKFSTLSGRQQVDSLELFDFKKKVADVKGSGRKCMQGTNLSEFQSVLGGEAKVSEESLQVVKDGLSSINSCTQGLEFEKGKKDSKIHNKDCSNSHLGSFNATSYEKVNVSEKLLQEIGKLFDEVPSDVLQNLAKESLEMDDLEVAQSTNGFPIRASENGCIKQACLKMKRGFSEIGGSSSSCVLGAKEVASKRWKPDWSVQIQTCKVEELPESPRLLASDKTRNTEITEVRDFLPIAKPVIRDNSCLPVGVISLVQPSIAEMEDQGKIERSSEKAVLKDSSCEDTVNLNQNLQLYPHSGVVKSRKKCALSQLDKGALKFRTPYKSFKVPTSYENCTNTAAKKAEAKNGAANKYLPSCISSSESCTNKSEQPIATLPPAHTGFSELDKCSQDDSLCSMLMCEEARLEQELLIMQKRQQQIKPLPGTLLNMKSGCEQWKLKNLLDEGNKTPYGNQKLHHLGVNPRVLSIRASTAAEFRFRLADFYKPSDVQRVTLADGALLVPDNSGFAGKEEFCKAFLTMPGVDPSLLTAGWLDNHYRWIVWKLAAYEFGFPQHFGFRSLTPEITMMQLKYRYDREIDKCNRSAIRKILERDDSPAKRMVVCVSGMCASSENVESGISTTQMTLEVSDGWYPIRMRLDDWLTKLVAAGKIRIGQKLCVCCAELAGGENACHPLEAPASLYLKVSANCTRPAPWDAKLGYQADPRPFCIPIVQVVNGDGLVSCVDAVIMRIYSMMYLEKFPGGGSIFRNARAEQKQEQCYKLLQEEKFERLYAKLENAFEESNVESTSKRCRKKWSKEQIAGLDSGQDIYGAIASALQPDLVEEYLNEHQKKILESYYQVIRDRQRQKLQEEFQRALSDDKKINSERNVIPLIKLRIAGCCRQDVDQGTSTLLTIWKPSDLLLNSLSEGKRYRISNLQPSYARSRLIKSHGTHLTVTRNSHFQQLDIDENLLDIIYEPREVFSARDMKRNSSVHGEVDLVGIVLQTVRTATYSQKSLETLYAADVNGDMFGVRFWGSIKAFYVEDLLLDGQTFAASNLLVKYDNWKHFPCADACAEISHFTQNPQQTHLRFAMECLQKAVKTVPEILNKAKQELETILKCSTSDRMEHPRLHQTASNSLDWGISPGDSAVKSQRAAQRTKVARLLSYGCPPPLPPLSSPSTASRAFKLPKFLES